MITLPDVSLIAITSGEEQECIQALEYSAVGVTFGQKILFTDNESLHFNGKIIKTQKFSNISEWGKFVVFELWKYIDTKFVLLVHPDGFLVNPSSWNPNFLNYDYIGAPWPIPKDTVSFRDHYGNIIRVGNSVSLRSRRLLKLPSEIGLRWENFDGGFPHEDGFLCVQHRHTLVEKHKIKFAPLSLAIEFGREYELPDHTFDRPLTFHKWSGKNAIYPNFNRKKYLKKKFQRVVKKVLKPNDN